MQNGPLRIETWIPAIEVARRSLEHKRPKLSPRVLKGGVPHSTALPPPRQRYARVRIAGCCPLLTRHRPVCLQAKTTAKRARSQSFLDDDDDSGEDIATKSKAKSRRPRKSAASPPAQPVDPANAPSAPATEKTRAHCIKQLTSLFVSIFSASDADDAASAAVEARAAAFAEDVESELFEGFSELDPKGVRSPKTKYISKFRSLHYNLKTNAAFRSRISANELTASQIVTMSSEDLLRPELRAMADSVRAASLKQSVKEVLAAPTAKRTHKGEEEIDNLATTVMAAEERLRAEEEQRMDHERSATEANGSPGPSPRVAQTSAFGESFSPSTSATVPSADSPAAHRKRASLAGVDLSADDIGLDHDGVDSFIDAREASTGDSPSVDTADGEMRPPPPPKSRSSFDMSSIFGRIKPRSDSASAEPESTTPDKSPPPDLSTDQEIDALEAILAGTRPRKTADDDDDFENKLLGGSGPQKDATPRPTLEDLPSVWRGDLIVPEEGGFPAFCVQAGGRPFGPSPDVWKRLLPPTFAMDGRIPTSTANKYLVECSFAPSRELIVLGVLPDLTGPTEESPYKPHKEACLVKHQHIVDLYVKKDRVGVIAPKGELRKVVKDIYFLPLKKDDPLPEYIDLLDDHDIPTSRHRENNLLLAVLVLQKGVIPTVPTVTPATKQPAPSSIASTTSGLPARTPVAATVATAGSDSPFPGFGATSNTASRPIQPVTVPSTVPVAAGAAPNPFAGIDTAALQSLLANPSILHGALAHSQAPMTAVPQYHHTPVQGPPYMPMQPPPPTMHAPQWRGPPAAGPSTTFSSYSPFGAGGHTPPTQMAGGMSPQGLPGISPAREASAAGGSSGGGRGGAYVHPSRAALLEGAGGSDIGGGARDSRGGGSPPYDQDYGSASRGRGGSRGGRGGYRGRGGSQQEFVPSGTGWGRGRGGR